MAASHSTPGLTATLQLTQRPRKLAPPRSRESPAAYSLAIPRIATPAYGLRGPVRRLKTVRRPPIYPKSPDHLPCSSLTHPLPLPSPRPSVSFGGFGFSLLRRLLLPRLVRPPVLVFRKLTQSIAVDAEDAPLG